MATVTITITAGANTVGLVKTISGSDLLTRFIPAMRVIFGMPTATDDEIVAEWSAWLLRHTIQAIKGYEQSDQMKIAAGGVTEIPVT